MADMRDVLDLDRVEAGVGEKLPRGRGRARTRRRRCRRPNPSAPPQAQSAPQPPRRAGAPIWISGTSTGSGRGLSSGVLTVTAPWGRRGLRVRRGVHGCSGARGCAAPGSVAVAEAVIAVPDCVPVRESVPACTGGKEAPWVRRAPGRGRVAAVRRDGCPSRRRRARAGPHASGSPGSPRAPGRRRPARGRRRGGWTSPRSRRRAAPPSGFRRSVAETWPPSPPSCRTDRRAFRCTASSAAAAALRLSAERSTPAPSDMIRWIVGPCLGRDERTEPHSPARSAGPGGRPTG